jgi:hypothetical protein
MDSWKSGDRSQAMSEFPSLSEASTDKKRKTKNVLIVPLKTYKDELREKYTKTYSETENHKTRMCNSLDKNVPCWHGENCRFAHSLEELVIRDCRFKDRCQFIKIKKDKLLNDGSKTCCNKHPQESRDEVIKRTGLNKYNTSAPKHEEIDVEETKVDVEETKVDVEETKVDVEETKVSCDRHTNYNWANSIKASLKLPTQESFKFVDSVPAHDPLPTTFKFGGHRSPLLLEPPLEPLLEKEIVLRVPKVLAMQALELAMNSGNRCIRVEVIE